MLDSGTVITTRIIIAQALQLAWEEDGGGEGDELGKGVSRAKRANRAPTTTTNSQTGPGLSGLELSRVGVCGHLQTLQKSR